MHITYRIDFLIIERIHKFYAHHFYTNIDLKTIIYKITYYKLIL